MKNKDLAIIVLSCDRFSSLWPLFFKRLDQYFPTSDAKFYLLTNHLDYKTSGKHSVEVVCVGDDISWSDNLSKLLLGIQENNVLLLIEDGPFSMPVDISKIDFVYQMFLDENMNYLNLKASPMPDKNIGEFVGEISCSTGYRTALVPSMWKKKVLVSLLKSGESAWEFEVFGSERSKEYGDFYAIKKPIFSFDHIVIKGKIDRSIFKKLEHNGEHVGIEFPVMTFRDWLIEKIKSLRFQIVRRLLPERILNHVRKMKYKY